MYGVWYSGSLFEEQRLDRRRRPGTRRYELGAEAKEQDKYLFLWGKEAATYYQTLALDSAIKEGGDEVRLAAGEPRGGLLVAPGRAGGLRRG